MIVLKRARTLSLSLVLTCIVVGGLFVVGSSPKGPVLPYVRHTRKIETPLTFDGRVVGVADGDTITVLDSSNQEHRIRLQGIDAPEKGQAFGTRSKQNLSEAGGPNSIRCCRRRCAVSANRPLDRSESYAALGLSTPLIRNSNGCLFIFLLGAPLNFGRRRRPFQSQTFGITLASRPATKTVAQVRLITRQSNRVKVNLN